MPQQNEPENHRDNEWTNEKQPISRWIEVIDACRPGGDDLSQPELAELAGELGRNSRLAHEFRRAQQLDAALLEAVADVRVPDGLQERLLAGLRASSAGAGSSQSPASATVVPISAVAPKSRPARFLGGWITAGGVLAVAAGVLLMVYFFRPAPTEIGVDEILQLALDDHERIHTAADSARTSPVTDKIGDKKYPLSSSVRRGNAAMRPVQDFLGRSGILYELTTTGGVQASLYVVDLAGPHHARISDSSLLPKTPPARPPLSTGAGAVAVWEDQGLLYVLVVEGGAGAFRQFVHPDDKFAALETPHAAWLAGNRAPIGSGDAFGIVSLI